MNNSFFGGGGGGNSFFGGGSEDAGGTKFKLPESPAGSNELTPPPLPFLAESLDKYGLPYYGEGMRGYATKIFAKIFDPDKMVPKPSKSEGIALEEAREKSLDGNAWTDLLTKWTNVKDADIQEASVAVNLATRGEGEEGEIGKVEFGESVKTGAGILYRASGQAISGGLSALGLIDVASRKVQSFNVALDDIGDTSGILPDISNSSEAMERFFPGNAKMGRLGSLLDAFTDLNVVVGAYNVLRTVTAGQSIYDKKQTIKDTVRASNMVYTMYWDEAKKAEYMLRAKAGENPDLLMKDIELPWVELAGSIFGDPATYAGVGVISKLGKAKTPVRFFGKVMFEAPWEIVRLPTFSQVLGLKNIGRARLLGAGDWFNDIADPTLKKAFIATGDAVDELSGSKAVQNVFQEGQKFVKKMSTDYGFFAPDSGAKQDLMKKTVGTVFQSISGRWRNTDDMMRMFTSYKHLLEGTPEQAGKAIDFLKEMYGPVPFSEAGIHTATFFNRLVDEIDIAKFADARTEQVPKLIEDVMGKLYNVVEDMYPSVNDMQAASKTVKELGEAATGREKFLAEAFIDLKKAKPLVMVTNEVNNALLGNKVYRGLQGFYAGVFMGMRPAYAVRNLQSNALHIYHDLGATAGREALEGGAQALALSTTGRAIKKDLVTPLIDKEVNRIKEVLGGIVPTETLRGIGQVGVEGLEFGFLPIGADTEKWHSAFTVRTVVETEMEKVLRYGGIPSVTALEGMGLAPEMADRLYSLTLSNWGDAKKTMTAFRAEMANGFADTWRHLELDPTFKDLLRKSNLLDELEQIRKTAPDASTFSDQMDTFFAKIDELASRTGNEWAQVDADNPIVESIQYVEKAIAEGGRELMSLEELNGFKALTEYRFQLQTEFDDIARVLNSELGQSLPLETRKLFNQRFTDSNAILGEGAKKWRNFAAEVYDGVYAASKSGVPPSELWGKTRTVMLDVGENGKAVLRKINIADEFPNVDPATLTNSEYNSFLWGWFKRNQDEFWGNYTQAGLVEKNKILEEMAAAAGTTLDDAKIAYYQSLDNPKLTSISDLMDDIGKWQSKIDFESASKLEGQGKTLADMTDIANDFPKFKGDKAHLFNAVNADRRARGLSNFTTMDEVPWGDALASLRKRVPGSAAEAGARISEPAALAASKKLDLTSDLVEKAVDVPRHELPADVSFRFEQEAQRLSASLSEGTGPTRTTVDQLGDQGDVASVASTNIPWYRKLFEETEMGKPQVDAALQRIAEDHGKDKGIAVERLKEVMMDTFRYGDEVEGIPPDLAVLKGLNAPDDVLDEALDAYNGMTGQSLSLEEAIAATRIEVPPASLSREALLQEQASINKQLSDISPLATGNTPEALKGFEGLRKEIGFNLDFKKASNKVVDFVKKNGTPEQLSAIKGADQTEAMTIIDTIADSIRAGGAESGADMGNLKSRLKQIDEALQAIPQAMPPHVGSTRPTVTRQLHENLKGGLRDVLKGFKDETLRRWGETAPMSTKLTDEIEGGLTTWVSDLERRTVSNRAAVSAIANETRNFILHDYNKTYADKFASAFLMYHYWPSRTYARWVERSIDTPGMAAAYAKWRGSMEKIHSDQPEYYRYNLPIGKLPGMDNNPMFINLEATINPLYGLTGVDFNDPNKRVDWMSSAMDDMGKMGFNPAVPLQWAMAFRLMKKGEDDAARRWMGRAIPATRDLKAALNLLNANAGIDLMPDISAIPGAKFGEFDPFINATSGGTGLEAYEEGRTGRAMAAMIIEGMPAEAGLESLYMKQGDPYELAVHRQITERAPGQLASFFLGTGYKTRTDGDLEVDAFYNEYFNILSMRENISPEDYRQKMNSIKGKYEFADAVLLSKRGGDDRDAAYAYNVLSRLPPGDNYAVLEGIGISGDMVSNFYDAKGDFSEWDPQERDRFMAGILDIGAAFELPDDTTKTEWTEVRRQYSAMRDFLAESYGEDIWDKVNTFYDLLDTNRDEANLFKAHHPEVDLVNKDKQEIIVNLPLVYKYYGSIDKIESYFDGKTRAYLADKYGEDITEKQTEYYALKVEDPKEAKRFLKRNNVLFKYWDENRKLKEVANRAMVDFAKDLPDPAPGPEFREDFDPSNTIQELLAQGQQTQMSWQEMTGFMSGPLVQRVQQYWAGDASAINAGASGELDYLASRNGFYNGNDLLREAGFALQREMQGQPQPADTNAFFR